MVLRLFPTDTDLFSLSHLVCQTNNKKEEKTKYRVDIHVKYKYNLYFTTIYTLNK